MKNRYPRRLAFKLLCNDESPYRHFDFRPYLPKPNLDGTWTPGRWTPARKRVEPCAGGWHVIPVNRMSEWVGPYRLHSVGFDSIFLVETAGFMLDGGDKAACESIRLLKPVEETVRFRDVIRRYQKSKKKEAQHA